jgi:AcrR family transcriptional regulator
VSEPAADESLVAQAVRRRAGDRQTAAENEVRRLLEVGLALMRENPTTDVRVADIIRRAGVSNDAFYRAFKGKAELMAAIADEGSRRLRSYVRHQVGKAADPVAKVRACVRAVLAQATDEEVASTSRAVLQHVPRASATRANGFVDVEDEIALLLVAPLGELGSTDPRADGLVAACSVFGYMEHFLWSGRTPTEKQVEDMVTWIVTAAGGLR